MQSENHCFTQFSGACLTSTSITTSCKTMHFLYQYLKTELKIIHSTIHSFAIKFLIRVTGPKLAILLCVLFLDTFWLCPPFFSSGAPPSTCATRSLWLKPTPLPTKQVSLGNPIRTGACRSRYWCRPPVPGDTMALCCDWINTTTIPVWGLKQDSDWE